MNNRKLREFQLPNDLGVEAPAVFLQLALGRIVERQRCKDNVDIAGCAKFPGEAAQLILENRRARYRGGRS